eukprot:jgi/Botrbrau1/23058/Bobra.0243s0001.1
MTVNKNRRPYNRLPTFRTASLAALCMLSCSRIAAEDKGGTAAPSPARGSSDYVDDVSNSSSAVDYSPFSRMLAGALVLREGGIANATRALPYLTAVTQHYLDTQVYLNTHPKVMKLIKNFTDFHSYKDNTDLLDKLEKHMKKKGDKLGKHIMKEKDEKLTEHIQQKIENATAKLHSAKFDKDLEELNKHLAKFHIEVKPKEISAPTKFDNEAAFFSKSITGLSAAFSGVTWAPALVSYGAVGLSASAEWLSITPAVLQIDPVLASTSIQGVQVNPALLNVATDGVNVQPQGVAVAPSLFVVAPVGVNILPQGVSVAASGLVEASTGVNVQAQGVSWGPVNHVIP